MASGTYERELKGILHGDIDILEKVTKHCEEDEKEAYMKIIKRPFIILRAAGSFGVDLVAIRHDVSFPIEVKSSTMETIRFSDASGRASDQAKELIQECRRTNLIPIYAYRLKNQRGDAWRIFTVEMEKVEGTLKIVYRQIPKLTKSNAGHFILRWKEGMPLHKFIDYLCR